MADPKLDLEPNPSIDEPGAARAVQVSAMLGGSVVGVAHVSNRRGRAVTLATYGCLAGGAALLLLAIVSFGVGVSNVAFNSAQLEKHLAEGGSQHAWQPRRLSMVWDWLALGGLFAGVACIIVGLARRSDKRMKSHYRIGSASDVDTALGDTPAASFPLVAPSGDDLVLNVVPEMNGEMLASDGVYALADVARQTRARPSRSVSGAVEVPIVDGARFCIDAGQATIMIASMPAPRRHPPAPIVSMEPSLVAFIGGTGVAIAVLLMLARWIPPDPRSLALGLGDDRDRLSSVRLSATEDPRRDENEDNARDSGAESEAMTEETGVTGDEESAHNTEPASTERAVAEPSSRRDAVARAREAGIAGIMRDRQVHLFSQLVDLGDGAAAFAEGDAPAVVIGGGPWSLGGGFGSELAGAGPGVDGPDRQTIGVGSYLTLCAGSPTGCGAHRESSISASASLRERESRSPDPRVGEVRSDGALDKAIIRRLVRQRLPRIRHCYERELQVKDGLRGTVVAHFQISPNGGVLAASASGMGDDDVEDCIAETISRIRFPAARGGGLVDVRYPFTFQPSGG